jgi:WD40 repeat protein
VDARDWADERHFDGSSVLYWDRLQEPESQGGDDGGRQMPVSGILFTADTVMVQPTQKGFSFIWSVPNNVSRASKRGTGGPRDATRRRPLATSLLYSKLTITQIPLKPASILRILETLSPLTFSQATSSWPNRFIRQDAKFVLQESGRLALKAMGWEIDTHGKLTSKSTPTPGSSLVLSSLDPDAGPSSTVNRRIEPPAPFHLLRNHHAPLNSVRFNEGNTLLYSGDQDGFVAITDLRVRRVVCFWKAHEGGVLGLEEWDGQLIRYVGSNTRRDSVDHHI